MTRHETAALIEHVRARLQSEFTPMEINIEDDGSRHVGHREADGRAHLKLRLVSTCFAGLNRVARHRLIYAALSEEMAGPVHALNITALAPGEAT